MALFSMLATIPCVWGMITIADQAAKNDTTVHLAYRFNTSAMEIGSFQQRPIATGVFSAPENWTGRLASVLPRRGNKKRYTSVQFRGCNAGFIPAKKRNGRRINRFAHHHTGAAGAG